MENLRNSAELQPDSTVLVKFPGLYSEGQYTTGFEVYGDLDLQDAWQSYNACGKKIYFHSGSERAWDHETVAFDIWLQHNHGRKHWLPDSYPQKWTGVQIAKPEALYADAEGTLA